MQQASPHWLERTPPLPGQPSGSCSSERRKAPPSFPCLLQHVPSSQFRHGIVQQEGQQTIISRKPMLQCEPCLQRFSPRKGEESRGSPAGRPRFPPPADQAGPRHPPPVCRQQPAPFVANIYQAPLCIWFLGLINEVAEGFRLKGLKSIYRLGGHKN